MLKEVTLKDFCIHKNLSIAFKSGINVIVGENRQGKTQVLESICFGLFGKTQNSKLEKIINFDAEEATANIVLDTFDVTRKRNKTSSTLTGIKKLELDNNLNLDYQEFLSMFYISSHEQKSLFDPSYLRKFLLDIFNLDKYATKYQELRSEYTQLKAIDSEIKKPNMVLIKNRYARVKRLFEQETLNQKKYNDINGKISKALNQLSSKEGEVGFKKRNIQKKYNLLKSGKCPECTRDFDKDHIKEGIAKAEKAFGQIKEYELKIANKRKEIREKEVKCDNKINQVNRRMNRCRKIITILQEKSKVEVPKVNLERIKELEQIIPIFEPKGFPSYLLKVYIPVIIQTANNLLNLIFPDTVVDIRTEKPESNRPDFKPFVTRDGNVLELNELCGSERVLVNLCFRLGVMIIYKKLHNTCVDFMLVDEGFERIDDVNCIKVLDLLENCMSMGFINQVILVTHKDILKTQERVNYIELKKGV